MAWCPECRYEFVEGVKECPKCHVALVEDLSKIKNTDASDPEEMFLAEDSEETEEEPNEAAVFDHDTEDTANPNVAENIRKQGRPYVYQHPYQSKAQKAEDAKSSGIAQVLVGAFVLVFTILWAFDLLPIRMTIERRFISCGILGAFSLFLLILGVFSLRSFKKLAVFAAEEDRRTDEILKWGKSLETDAIDAPMEGLGLAEEEKYYGRVEVIRQLMTERFMNLDPDYAEDVCEKIYQQLYDEKG
ncbi:MAG: hypothetical protein IKO10_01160 [Lachnospiraceae bacterium]|nr:hypothetical protein [Lachnospiraceae bacterium]